MPTTRVKRTRGRVSSAGITEADFIYFSWGDFFEAENYADGKTEEDLKAFWKAHRESIMTRYMEENRLKGRKAGRPWAFWDYDMSEPQRKTPPGEFDSQKVWDHQKRDNSWVENDFDYLKRLNLLEQWEIEK